MAKKYPTFSNLEIVKIITECVLLQIRVCDINCLQIATDKNIS